MKMTFGVILFLLLLLPGCALQPYGLLYSRVVTGEDYPRPWTHRDLDLARMILVGPTRGEACSTNVLGLVARGTEGSTRPSVIPF